MEHTKRHWCGTKTKEEDGDGEEEEEEEEEEAGLLTGDEVEAAPVLGHRFDLAGEQVDARRRLGLVAVVDRQEAVADLALALLPHLQQHVQRRALHLNKNRQ